MREKRPANSFLEKSMKYLLVKWIVNSTALLVVAHIVSGVTLDNWRTVFVAALVLGLLNAFLRPVLIFLTLPVTVLTLGLFTLFINAFLFYMAAHLVRGFHVAGYWQAFVAAFVFSLISFLLSLVLGSGSRR
jgi:putative membrane protein